jgi:Putative zinc-finger
VKAEMRCSDVRVELSARLDDEIDRATSLALDDHLATCADCRAYEERLRLLTRAVRLQPADAVPDLAPRIMRSVRHEVPRLARRREWWARGRIAVAAGMATILLLLGATAPWFDRPSDTASAAHVVRSVRAAATDLDRYHATFSLTERGWHPQIPQRSFVAEVWFEAPESFRLRVRDLTEYPDARWPANDVDLVANARRWWIREPSSCPAEAMPACAPVDGSRVEQRLVAQRQPFDGSSSLPTDIAIPLETLATPEGVDVRGDESVLGKDAIHLSLPYLKAAPLVNALQAGGDWRTYHPLDRVELWLDTQTWFPLRFDVVAGSSVDRRIWARAEGLAPERPGKTLLSARATSFSEDIEEGLFTPPARSADRSGNFRPVAPALADPSLVPSVTAGLEAYAAGRTGRSRELVAFSNGMAWMKVSRVAPRDVTTSSVGAEEVELSDGGFGYYYPASTFISRRVDLFTPGGHLRVESNLTRGDLFAVAASLPSTGSAAPRRVTLPTGAVVERIDVKELSIAPSFVDVPQQLPGNYRAVATFLTTNGARKTYSTYYRSTHAALEDAGIRIVQATGSGGLVPSSEDPLIHVDLDGLDARWSSLRGELEWIEDGTYRAISIPAFGLEAAVAIARSMR